MSDKTDKIDGIIRELKKLSEQGTGCSIIAEDYAESVLVGTEQSIIKLAMTLLQTVCDSYNPQIDELNTGLLEYGDVKCFGSAGISNTFTCEESCFDFFGDVDISDVYIVPSDEDRKKLLNFFRED